MNYIELTILAVCFLLIGWKCATLYRLIIKKLETEIECLNAAKRAHHEVYKAYFVRNFVQRAVAAKEKKGAGK